jgi:signal transduction histidine kinase
MARRGEAARARRGDVVRTQADFESTVHDLIGALSALSLQAQVLAQKVAKDAVDREGILESLGALEQRTNRLVAPLRVFLDAAEVETGNVVLRLEPVDLVELLESVVGRLAALDRRRIMVRSPGGPAHGEWDRERIERVLENLIDNALKYSPPDSPITAVVQVRPPQVELALTDGGIGILAEEVPLLFQRFYRTPRARDAGVRGAGLGLYACRRVVEAHGGQLAAESAGAQRGATFRLILPLHPGVRLVKEQLPLWDDPRAAIWRRPPTG